MVNVNLVTDLRGLSDFSASPDTGAVERDHSVEESPIAQSGEIHHKKLDARRVARLSKCVKLASAVNTIEVGPIRRNVPDGASEP